MLDELETLRPRAVFIASYSYDTAASAPVAQSHSLMEQGAALAAGEHRFIAAVARSAAKTFVLRDNPAFPTEPARCLLSHPRHDEQCQWPVASLGNKALYPTADLTDLVPRVELVETQAWVCPGGICAAASGGLVMMRDTHHLTASFAARLTPQFEQLLAVAADARMD